jgi:hypothetical protein
VTGRLEATYSIRDVAGREVTQHLKYRHADGSKSMPYRHRGQYRWLPGKPAEADRYLFRGGEMLDEIGPRPARSTLDQVWLPEGEGDALTLAGLDLVAASHHQGAAQPGSGRGGMSLDQAAWLVGFRGRVVLAADRDRPGAVDVVRRYDLLRSVGIPRRHLRIVVALRGKDVTDHLVKHQLPLSALMEVPIGRARLAATRASAATYRRAGYRAAQKRRWAL